jgi:hypothetical protein
MKKIVFFITFLLMLKSSSNFAQGIVFTGYRFVKNDLVRTTDNAIITKEGYGQIYLKIENSTSEELLAIKFNVTIDDVFGKRILKLKNVEKQLSVKAGNYGYIDIQAFKDYPDLLASLLQGQKEKENFHKIDDSSTLKVIVTTKEVIFKNHTNKLEETVEYTLEKIF